MHGFNDKELAIARSEFSSKTSPEWEELLLRAQKALATYGWGLIGVYGFALWYQDAGNEVAGIIAAVLNLGLFSRLAVAQLNLIKFRPGQLIPTTIFFLIFALIGCAGLLIWLVMWGTHQKIERNLRFLITQNSVPPIIKSKPFEIKKELPISQDCNFHQWKDNLNNYLLSINSATKSIHFRPEALNQGYIYAMTPQEFIKIGYNKSVSVEALDSFVTQNEKRNEALD